MIEPIEAALRTDLESNWPDATFVDARTNTGYDQEGRTTSYAFRILHGDRKHELVIGPRAVRGGDVDAVIESLRASDWTRALREEDVLLLEVRGGGLTLGARPDSLVL